MFGSPMCERDDGLGRLTVGAVEAEVVADAVTVEDGDADAVGFALSDAEALTEADGDNDGDAVGVGLATRPRLGRVACISVASGTGRPGLPRAWCWT